MSESTSQREERAWQLLAIAIAWRGWCQDGECPNHPFYGVKPGTKLRIRLPADYGAIP